MKVFLVLPVPPRTHWPQGLFQSHWVPTGLAYIAAGLKRAGHEVRVHSREERLIKNGFDWAGADAEFRRILEEFRPELVGFSVFSSSVPETATLSHLVKEVCGSGVLVVAGGVHPTALPERTLQDCPSLDAVVVGEGEGTMATLAERGLSLEVPGLVLRQDGGFVATGNAAPQPDLDALGPPAYDLFDMRFYTERTPWLIRWLPLSAINIRTSRGCPGNCRFCAGHLVSGPGIRRHSVEYVIDQISYALRNWGIEAVHFEDDTIGSDRAWLLALCEALRRKDLHRRIRWEASLRVEQADREILVQMKSAGCIQVEYGFESGSDACLRRIGKGTTVEMNRRAVELTREAGLRIYADIMVGLPGETEADVEATIAFVRWARPDIISASRLSPLPGTPIYNDLPQEVRDSLNWADYAYHEHPIARLNLTAMTAEQFEKIYRRFRKYFVRPLMLWHFYRDSADANPKARRRLRRKILRFVLQHPLRAARLPW